GSGGAQAVGASGSAGGLSGGSGGAVAGAVSADGPGVTPTTVSIGVAYFENANAANAAIGGKGVKLSDPTPTAKAIVADINKHGGIAGRKVLPLFWGVDPQSSTPYAT